MGAAVTADAMEEAGCHNEELLASLRDGDEAEVETVLRWMLGEGDPTIARFAEDVGMPLDTARLLSSMASAAMDMNEHASNGDPHPRNDDPEDKNRNAELWEADLEHLTKELSGIANTWGAKVEYNGLRPSLMIGKQYVHIP